MNAPEIVVVGSYNLDLVFSVERLPAPGETCIGASQLRNAGGKGSNQAIQAARCGGRVAMVAAIGQDAAADEALAVWAAEGIDARAVARIAGAETGAAVILVDARGENSIVVASGANARLGSDHVQAAANLMAEAKLVVGQLEVPLAATARAFEIARAAGARTLLNAAPADTKAARALLPLTDIVVVNALEGAAMSGREELGEIGAALLDLVPTVVVTLGAQGAVVFQPGRAALIGEAFPVAAVDTTGAGDAFVGAFAAQLASGASLPTSLSWGLAAGALACTVRGVLASFATSARVRDLAADQSDPDMEAEGIALR